jgi:xylulokinase
VREKTIGASYGDAFLAALAVGDARKEDIRTWNPVAYEIVADPVNADVYARQFAVFKDIYARTHDLMRRLEG